MPPIDTLYIIHHSHTDFGYTHDLPVFFEMQDRFLDEALNQSALHTDTPAAARFRWTVETTDVLRRWLERATLADVARLQAAERAGLLEICAMFANITPLYDTAQLIESLQEVGRLRRELGVEIRHAMNCDVNGQNWGLVDLLLDAGVEGLTMAINPHFGGAPKPRPAIFQWEGPSGRRIPAFSGWPYNTAGEMGIPRDAAHLREFWPQQQAYLDEIGWPLPILMIQHTHPFTDNGTADPLLSDFVAQWNADGGGPRLVIATPTMWWEAVKAYHDLLPVWRGDWTDFWNFGAISSARADREPHEPRPPLRRRRPACRAHPRARRRAPSRARHRARRPLAESHLRALPRRRVAKPQPVGRTHLGRGPIHPRAGNRGHPLAMVAQGALRLSGAQPQSDAATRCAGRAGPWRAREANDDLLVFNPLPWPRTVTGPVLPGVLERGTPEDSTAGRHFQDRFDRTRLYAAHDEHEGPTSPRWRFRHSATRWSSATASSSWRSSRRSPKTPSSQTGGSG